MHNFRWQHRHTVINYQKHLLLTLVSSASPVVFVLDCPKIWSIVYTLDNLLVVEGMVGTGDKVEIDGMVGTGDMVEIADMVGTGDMVEMDDMV